MAIKALIGIVSFLAGLLVYDVFFVDLYLATQEPDTKYLQCPQDINFNYYWNAWSYEYINNNPDVGIDTQMSDWNALMIENECGEQWLNPLDDLIEQYGASGTPVYWYDTPR